MFDDADLPGILSQIVLPLNSHGRTMGVLDIQSTERAAFSDQSRAVLQTLADQLAVAIEHARLVERTEAQLRELSRLSGKYSAEAWGRLATPEQTTGYTYDQVGVVTAPEIASPVMDRAMSDGKTVVEFEPERTRAELAAPLKVRDRIIGALAIQENDREHEWSAHEIALVEAVSEQVAQALENARLFAESRKSAQTMQALYETSRALSSALEQEKLIRTMLESVYQTLGCEHAIISTVDPNTKTIGIRHGIWNGQHDVFPKWIQKAQYPLDHPDILADVYRTGQTEIIDGWDARFNREVWEEFGHERLVRIFMPIKIRDRVLGVIEVGYDRRQKSKIGEEEVQMLAAFADQAAVALENVRLFEQAQQRAHREHQTYEITSKIRRSSDVATMLQTTVDELGQALQTDRTLIRLKVKLPEPSNPPDPPEQAPSGESMPMENCE